MAFSEQREMIEALRDFEHKMGRNELEDYRMFVKRHKDDEELDQLSLSRLRELHDKYFVNRPRKKFIDPFKR